MRDRLVTIHGINTGGAWQGRVGALLDLFFEHTKLDYPHYRYLGTLALVAEPWVVVAIVAAIPLAPAWPWIALLATVGPYVAWRAAAFRRNAARRSCEKKLGATGAFEAPPHVIAHSFGTWLLNDLLRYQEVELDRVVLVGSILPQTLDWQGLLEDDRVRAVWNEVASGDQIVKAGKFIRRLVPGLGPSGLDGFADDDLLVHTRKDAITPCDKCRTSVAPVHNVPLAKYDHHDAFLGVKHAARFWLPFFWNIEPQEYRALLRLCLRAVRYLEEGNEVWFERSIEVMLRRRWRWSDNLPLDEYLERELQWRGADPDQRDDLCALAAGFTCVNMHEAVLASRIRGAFEPGKAESLKPTIAVGRAIEQVLAS